jgi:hypothetical protein
MLGTESFSWGTPPAFSSRRSNDQSAFHQLGRDLRRQRASQLRKSGYSTTTVPNGAIDPKWTKGYVLKSQNI